MSLQVITYYQLELTLIRGQMKGQGQSNLHDELFYHYISKKMSIELSDT